MTTAGKRGIQLLLNLLQQIGQSWQFVVMTEEKHLKVALGTYRKCLDTFERLVRQVRNIPTFIAVSLFYHKLQFWLVEFVISGRKFPPFFAAKSLVSWLPWTAMLGRESVFQIQTFDIADSVAPYSSLRKATLHQ